MKKKHSVRNWTDSDNKKLIELLKKDMTLYDVAETLSRVKMDVLAQMRYLSGMESKFDDSERQAKLRNQYLTIKQIYVHKNEFWTEQQEFELKRLWEKEKRCINEVVDYLGRSRLAVILKLEDIYSAKERAAFFETFKGYLFNLTKIEQNKPETPVIPEELEVPEEPEVLDEPEDLDSELEEFIKEGLPDSPEMQKPALVLRHYDYEKCLLEYEVRIQNVKRATVEGQKAIAKPALICAVLIACAQGVLNDGRIYLNDTLRLLYAKVFKMAKGPGSTKIEYPFYFLHSDGFWHLHWKDGEEIKTETPSAKFLEDHVKYVTLDDDLWFLIQNREYRARLFTFIKESMLVGWE